MPPKSQLLFMKSFLRYGLVFVLAFLVVACEDDPLRVDTSEVEYTIDLRRFDRVLHDKDTSKFDAETWPELQARFQPFLESVSREYMKRQAAHPNMLRLQEEIDKAFPNFAQKQTALEVMLRHFYYYWPSEPAITVYAYNSGLDFDFPIIFVDTLLFVSLDNYLGKNHPAYKPLDNYIAYFKQPEFLVRDAAQEMMMQKVKDEEDESFVNQMVYWGKVLYATHALTPYEPDTVLFRFSKNHLDFCRENEASIWHYFIENEVLFNTSKEPQRRFLELAPFSKFNAPFDSETPGMIGRWVGYRIVESYMKNHPGTPLPKLLEEIPAREIFTKSKYKP